LLKIDGKPYRLYTSLLGAYDFSTFAVYVDYVQPDPFAAPSLLRVAMPLEYARVPEELYSTEPRRMALEDYIARRFADAIRRIAKGERGTGHSGRFYVDAGRQQVLRRTACRIFDDRIEIRLAMGLPAAGRDILGRQARAMFFEELPAAVGEALVFENWPEREPRAFVESVEDQEALRDQLASNGLVAFVGNGSVLPRESGISDRPLRSTRLVPFESPPELAMSLRVPNRGEIVGMGIPEGVTLIVGGGYHGKSTLLRALEMGIYNHVPGDGRELVVTRRSAVKIRAEDGRSVEGVDISPFIDNLPNREDTKNFRTENASGSTSQAANIMEALEAGAEVLLMDEDTCATNFMIRDELMQELVPKEKEPITPFIDQVRNIYRELGVSTVLVMGGSGEYFAVADTVLMMDSYRPRVVTERAKELVDRRPVRRRPEGPGTIGPLRRRIPLPRSVDPSFGKKIRAEAKGLSAILFGPDSVDLRFIEQLVDPSQAESLANMLLRGWKHKMFEGTLTLRQIAETLHDEVLRRGLDVLSRYGEHVHPGNMAEVRPVDFLAVVNRLRSLRVRHG
jgi:predicted ABC-class ATPase